MIQRIAGAFLSLNLNQDLSVQEEHQNKGIFMIKSNEVKSKIL